MITLPNQIANKKMAAMVKGAELAEKYLF
jgi:hypothetical protein